MPRSFRVRRAAEFASIHHGIVVHGVYHPDHNGKFLLTFVLSAVVYRCIQPKINAHSAVRPAAAEKHVIFDPVNTRTLKGLCQ